MGIFTAVAIYLAIIPVRSGNAGPRPIFVFLAIGFFLAVIFARAFEFTPDGLQRKKDEDRAAVGLDETDPYAAFWQ